MKRLMLALALVGGFMVVGVPALANNSGEEFDLPNGTQVKVDICHNVDHNPVIVPVNINSADFPFDTGHGELVLNDQIGYVSFAPHTETGGHEHDFVVRVYTKHGNDETNTYESEDSCPPEEPELLTAFVCFEGDIVTFDNESQEALNLEVSAYLEAHVGAVQVLSADAECEVVITTTTSSTTTTTTVVVEETPVTETPALRSAPAPAPTSAPAPVSQLPRTGSGTLLTLLGGALTSIGLIIRRLFR